MMRRQQVSVHDANDGATDTKLAAWVSDLASGDPIVRQRARAALVQEARRAMGHLIRALAEPHDQVRWEAARALVDIADPAAGPALIRTLEDRDAGTRWVAAEALIALGAEAVPWLLQALTERRDSLFLREGAHHVLCELKDAKLREIVSPVTQALVGHAPEHRAPVAADTALKKMRNTVAWIDVEDEGADRS